MKSGRHSLHLLISPLQQNKAAIQLNEETLNLLLWGLRSFWMHKWVVSESFSHGSSVLSHIHSCVMPE